MIVIGVDPGTARTGYGLVEGAEGRLRLVDYGCITTTHDQSPEIRLKVVFDDLLAVIREFRPELMAVEQLFFNRNAKTAFAVGQSRGVALLAAACAGIKVAEFTPLAVKIAVSGYGRAEKFQIQRMVQSILGLESPPQPDDVSDALAVAICGLNSRLAGLEVKY